MSNKRYHESDFAVNRYKMAKHLQKPEQTILNIFKNKLKNMKMLDLGVGGGRTSIHFARLVKEYVGVDYSKNMIEACKNRIPEGKNISFKVADARDLSEFENDSFDMVLCSFNGLDYISHDDRMIALNEIMRVLKNDGIFIFSAHNLNHIHRFFSFEWCKNPIRLACCIIKLFFRLLLNGSPKKLQRKGWAIIKSEAIRFWLKTYYITPRSQIRQLNGVGFTIIRLFSLYNGNEINADRLEGINDPWIYYLCKPEKLI